MTPHRVPPACPIGREILRELLPHRGAMCLLDSVERWDDDSILCRATSHALPDNPLRREGRLDAIAGVEYASQAVAIHGALKTAGARGSREAYLATVSKVVLGCEQLDTYADTLEIEAKHLTDNRDACIYTFSVCAAGEELLSGKVMIAFRDLAS